MLDCWRVSELHYALKKFIIEVFVEWLHGRNCDEKRTVVGLVVMLVVLVARAFQAGLGNIAPCHLYAAEIRLEMALLLFAPLLSRY
jgi:hypothetical protein